MPAVPIGRIFADLAQESPTSPAVSCAGMTITHDELERRSNRLARAYATLGVADGDMVTIALPNGIEFVLAAAATWKLGATVQPISAHLPGSERDRILELAKPALAVGVDPERHPEWTAVPPGYEPPALSEEPLLPDRVAPAWKAMTSGGTTGKPKLIVAGAPGAANPTYGRRLGMRECGVTFIPGPLYHNLPFGQAFTALFYGNHVVLLERFEAEAALRTIADYRVDFTAVVPTMMSRMLRVLDERPGEFDLSSLQVLWHGSAPCPAWVKERWIKLIGTDAIREMYGATEGHVLTTITGTEWLERRGSVGRPMFGEIAILDEAGAPCAPGVLGEVWVRGSSSSASTYRYVGADVRERDGWESVGDLGHLDADGYLYLSDRRTDLIISGGANVYPAEVEAALTAFPGVEAAVVVGLPDEDLGNRVHAVVQSETEVDLEALRAFLSERLVRYKVPRSFRVVHEPVHTDAGKIRRAEIREREALLMAPR